MPDEIQQSLPVENTEVVQEQVQTEQGQATPAENTQVQEDANIIKSVVDGEEIIYDLTNPEDRKRLQEDAQKGIHFTRKSQSVAEWEKAQRANIEMSQALLGNNPDIFKMAIAKANGLRPELVAYVPQPPNPEMENINPALYYQQVAEYNLTIREKQAIDNVVSAATQNFARQNNTAVYEKSRVVNNLSDGEMQAIQTFMETRMKPSNALGMWSDEDMNFAISAVLGRERNAKQQIDTVNKLNKSLRGSQPTGGSVSQKRAGQSLTPQDEERQRMFDKARERKQNRS